MSCAARLPLIFIHYGRPWYLRQALKSAKRSNPDKKIILLGDSANKAAARGVCRHLNFNLLDGSARLQAFERVFKPIQGSRHKFNKAKGTTFWLRFVFKRWFLMAEFLRAEGIDAFWTFDTDTLVLAPLAPREPRFANVQATVQCDGSCLNGFIGSAKLVWEYTDCILDLFSDGPYLEAQRKRLSDHAGLAFNEMDAFGEFRRRNGVHVRRAAEAINGEIFDDALAFPGGYEPAGRRVLGRTNVKRLWCSHERGLYARLLPGGDLVRMLTCNMSWMPDYVWKKLVPFSLTPEQDAKLEPPAAAELREVNLSQPLTDKVATVLRRRVFELKRTLGR
jgi:hypothetical protein